MIAFGITNFIFSVIVGVLARRVAAEALVGVAAVLQLCLAVFLLVWIPDDNLTPVFFAVSALWGMCDAICLLYTSPSPRDGLLSRMPSSA